MELAGWPGSDTRRRSQAVEVIVTGSLGPSVRASVGAARMAAQAVRPSLPSELYEQVNALHWRAQEPTWQRDLYPFLTDVQLSIRLVDGLIVADGKGRDVALANAEALGAETLAAFHAAQAAAQAGQRLP